MEYPSGYLNACIKSDVDDVLSRIEGVKDQDRKDINEFIDDMFAADREPFHVSCETADPICVRAIFGGISGCYYAIPDIPECYFAYPLDLERWAPSERLRLVSTAVALTISSSHGAAVASDDSEPILSFIEMLNKARKTGNGFACLAALYALGRLQTDRSAKEYLSHRRRQSLRVLALDATSEVLAAMLLDSPEVADGSLISEIRQRLGYEWTQCSLFFQGML